MNRLLLLFFIFFAGCTAPRPAPPELSMKQLWLNKGGDYRPRQDKQDFSLPYDRMRAVLLELPRARFSREFDHLVQSPRTTPSLPADTSFDDLLLICMPSILAERHDEKRMIALLAHHCTDSQYDVVEFIVACNFENAVSILAKSYRQSKTIDGRRSLVRVFRRAFPAVTTGVAADKVVDSCVRWYQPRQTSLVVNLEYRLNYGISNTSNNANQNPQVGFTDESDPTAPPLFIAKSEESASNAEGRKSLDIR